MIVRPDVDTLMAGDLGRWLASQSDVRNTALRTSKRRVRVALIVGVIVGVFALIVSDFNFELALASARAIIGLGFAWAQAAKRPVERAIKQEMNGCIAKALGLEFASEVVPGTEFETAKAFQMLPSHDNQDFEDRWSGQIGAVPFSLFEAHLQEWRQSGKNRQLVTVFRGSIMTVGFGRRFRGATLVEREGRRMTFFGLRDRIELGGIKLDRVKMVDPRFEDEFQIWSNDAVEAHYLVHPEYVERLIAVEQAFHGQKIRALFYEERLLIALESGNLFESGSVEVEGDRDRLALCVDQFAKLADLATHLNERPRGFSEPEST